MLWPLASLDHQQAWLGQTVNNHSSHLEATSPPTTASVYMTTTTIAATSIIRAAHRKYCHVDNTAKTQEDIQLIQSLTNTLLDGNRASCVSCFESGSKQLQVTFNVPGSVEDLEVSLVGNHVKCQEPFTVVYTDLFKSGVTKRQCNLRQATVLNNASDQVECNYICRVDKCLGKDVQLTTLFELPQRRTGNKIDTRLCEVAFRFVNNDEKNISPRPEQIHATDWNHILLDFLGQRL